MSLDLRRYFFRILVAFGAAAFITACGSQPTKPSQTSQSTGLTISLENVTATLDAADQADIATRVRTYLDVTQALLDADEVDWARNTLAQVAPYTVPEEQFIRYAVVSSALAVAQGRIFRAKAFLWEDRVLRVAERAPTEERVKLHEMRARLLFGLAEYRNSVDERLRIYELTGANSDMGLANQEALWQTLMELPYEDLRLESQLQTDMLARGWYTLAALSKDNQTNLSQQLKAVENWQLSWPEHPASLLLPADLQLLQQLDSDKPKQIAIMLPFSGRFAAPAQAIRDGIMAAYYDASSSETSLPDLRIYDSSVEDISALYDEAVLNGAKLVIGPLEQEKIEVLALRSELAVPVLALNRLPKPVDVPRGLFQFGLALEDEAEQAAVQAWRDGYRHAMLLAPQGNNGDRSVEAFRSTWLALGGKVTEDYRFSSQAEYSDLIKSALKIDQSELRRRELRQLVGEPIEFEPRRRKDIDFIFMYSHASQARQLKPILAFHYAGDVPVYALRNIYNGQDDAKRDKDLNDIRFTTLPWYFDDSLPEKRAITQNKGQDNYQFLYALGVDAYHIHPRLRQLQEVKQASFYGATGKLRLDDQQRIHREQVWAKFQNGRALPVTTFSSDDDQ